MHKTAEQFAIKHHISLGLHLSNGHYFIGTKYLSNYPTAKSAIVMMKRYLKSKQS